MSDRKSWLIWLEKVARPILEAGSCGKLHERMPVETTGNPEQAAFRTHLEAIGRSLCGIAPWLECENLQGDEAELQKNFREMALATIDHATKPGGPDRCNFSGVNQPLVDAAFLAHALLRAPKQLAASLSDDSKENLIACLYETRQLQAYFNNWLLFAAMVEAGLDLLGEEPDLMRIDYAIRQHEQWYLGDGIYGDGPQFHWDHYNSYVIQPMLVDINDHFETQPPQGFRGFGEKMRQRFSRYATIQERLIASDGSFPAIGRSLCYRAGAFQALAQAALQHRLEEKLNPAAVRCALYAVIDRTLSPSASFDDNGWLRPGLAGHQPSLGENYISTGSLYLCAAAFLPLGLDPRDPFWADADADWTAKRIWAGGDMPKDSAL